ncbi:MAG: sigma 54-interacting transcriptional regulator [Gammaproteobacteria bacterium]
MIAIDSDQRQFFRQLADIAFTNPFGLECVQKECELIGADGANTPPDDREAKIREMARFHFLRLEEPGRFDIRHCAEKDREMMKIAWLFWTYRDFQDDFDRLIRSQTEQGDDPVELTFYRPLASRFEQAGFDPEEASRYIALFYQLRRGFDFIGGAISGDSPAVVDLRMRLWNNIFTFDPDWYLNYLCGNMEDFSTLLLGETGTGKSLVARAIGCSGFIPFDAGEKCFRESFTRSFLSINLSQFPSGLLESELFGHKKGAFTGAVENHAGVFSRCSAHGAVFIDEIGDIDIPTQVKLLNVIQDRVFSPVGSHERHRFEGRVIAATNKDIDRLLEQGQFRSDLYYRLCSDVIELPPLRQRLEENPGEMRKLVESLLGKMLSETDERLADRVEKRLRESVPPGYPWPGNVRELEQCIRRICLTGAYRAGRRKTQPDESQNRLLGQIDEGALSAQKLLQAYCRRLYEIHGSYEAVSRIANLDRRTAKKYIIEN